MSKRKMDPGVKTLSAIVRTVAALRQLVESLPEAEQALAWKIVKERLCVNEG